MTRILRSERALQRATRRRSLTAMVHAGKHATASASGDPLRVGGSRT